MMIKLILNKNRSKNEETSNGYVLLKRLIFGCVVPNFDVFIVAPTRMQF